MDAIARRFLTIATLAAGFLVLFTSVAEAGFGITPPYVQTNRLTRGSVYEQQITLVRSDPTSDLEAQITLNVPGVESWFSIDKGLKFIMPKDATQVPIVVKVQVPEDAAYGVHKGAIRVRTSNPNIPEGGGVSIALGAQIDVDIEVVDQILDFTVRKIRLADLEEGRRKWGFFFPGKIRFFITVENTGNAPYAPTSVRFEIYDLEKETLLETTENTNDIELVDPFAIKEVVAELPTRLPAGRYIAKYTIFKGSEVAQQQEVSLSISMLGAVAGYEGYGFDGLTPKDYLKIAVILTVPVLFVLITILILIRRRMMRKKRMRMARSGGVMRP